MATAEGMGGGPVSQTGSPWGRSLGAVMTASALAALYLLFVLHFSVNLIFWDEWSLVPVIHAALHSDLTFGALWAQHNENRMLVPNLIIVGSALVHDHDSKTIILLGAAVFVVSYGLLLATFRIYLGRSGIFCDGRMLVRKSGYEGEHNVSASWPWRHAS